ncbi:MAG: hypothetical protein WD359_06905 [Dehalococcoidia bacterium]
MAITREELARRTRRLLISVARRRQKPGSGSLLKLTDWSDMAQWPDLTGALEGLRWAIVGAVATRLYMPERATSDLDVVVLAGDANTAEARLSAAGYEKLGALSIGGSTWRAPSGQQLDLISVDGSRWVTALELATTNADPAGSRVLTLPFLVLMKLESGRLQDVADVGRMLGFADDQGLADVRNVIGQYAPEVADDLASMIELGKLEHDSGPDA